MEFGLQPNAERAAITEVLVRDEKDHKTRAGEMKGETGGTNAQGRGRGQENEDGTNQDRARVHAPLNDAVILVRGPVHAPETKRRNKNGSIRGHYHRVVVSLMTNGNGGEKKKRANAKRVEKGGKNERRTKKKRKPRLAA